MAQPERINSVPLPQNVKDILLLKLPEGEIADWAVEAMVVEAVRERIVSRQKAATILGFEDYESREAFFTRHQLFNEYTLEMLALDFKTMDRPKQ